MRRPFSPAHSAAELASAGRSKPLQFAGSSDLRRIAGSSSINLIGSTVPVLLGLLTIPLFIRFLGPERFAVYALANIALGYGTLLNLGLGRAVTHFVAIARAAGDHRRTSGYLWTGLTASLMLGVAGSALVSTLAPVMISMTMMPTETLAPADVASAAYLASMGLPFLLLADVLRGVLEGSGRFRTLNFVQVPSDLLARALPILILLFDARLEAVLVSLVAGRVVIFVGLLIAVVPSRDFRSPVLLSLSEARLLVSSTGWLTITNVVGPLMVSADRFIVAPILGLSSVAYYSAAFQPAYQLQILPWSIARVLFPFFSSSTAISDEFKTEDRYAVVYTRVLQFTILAMAGVCTLLILLSSPLFVTWLGPDIAQQAITPFRILLLGAFSNGVAKIPYALIQGNGRADITAKYHLIEFSIYLVLLPVLTMIAGLSGAATAWALRSMIDLFLLLRGASLFTTTGGDARLPYFSAALGVTTLASLIVASERLCVLC